MSTKIRTENLRLAQLRFYETQRNGTEILPMLAYAFLLKNGDQYINILNPEEEYPVYGRVPYSNTTISGEDYGTKIILLSGEERDGLCYVLENRSVSSMFGNKEEISFQELQKYVMFSSDFFVDRMKIVEEEKKVLKRKGICQKDFEKHLLWNSILAKKEEEVQLKKK